MGNNPTKESRTPPQLSPTYASYLSNGRHQFSPSGPSYSSRDHHVGRAGGDLSLASPGGASDVPIMEHRRETRVEREARKAEKERIAREKERERSMKEEGVDGGYLVTLGTYTGPEDFSKPIVRQLMIERRLAPFWKGLNDHSESWTEYQLVAAARGLPIPAPDEPPSDELKADLSPRVSGTHINQLTVPIAGRSMSSNSEQSTHLSPSHPAFSVPSPTSPLSVPNASSPLFRGRAKTLASLTTSSRNNSQAEMTPQEMYLPKDPHVNGQRVEAFLYKDASECPICFLYYPPYLNRTRCCDQPICSECFVQIKRPDPHPPEHADPNDPESQNQAPGEDSMLVSEPAACPFCVQPEFGVTYDPPPFRRGLAYQNGQGNPLGAVASAMSSTSSLSSGGLSPPGGAGVPGRRRTTSLSASAPQVITTDRVRPDWAKKLADARAHALRRSAAATALHNAAYMMGNYSGGDGRAFTLGRRRRMFSGDSPNDSGTLVMSGNPAGYRDGQMDLPPGRHSSRRHRVEDLEELMMEEAIRLSLAAEEDRKRKEDKEAAKKAKKEGKQKAKELKKVAKEQSRIPRGFHPVAIPDSPVDDRPGKGKAVDRTATGAGFNPIQEPTSTLNQSHSLDSQDDLAEPSQVAYSSASSTSDSVADSLHQAASLDSPSNSGLNVSDTANESEAQSSALHNETSPQQSPGLESMFNFRSLAAIIDSEDDKETGTNHIENVEAPSTASPQSLGQDPPMNPPYDQDPAESSSKAAEVSASDEMPEGTNMEESTVTLKPNGDAAPESQQAGKSADHDDNDDAQTAGNNMDTKQPGDIRVLDTGLTIQ